MNSEVMPECGGDVGNDFHRRAAGREKKSKNLEGFQRCQDVETAWWAVSEDFLNVNKEA
jgi:hypothetical protein